MPTPHEIGSAKVFVSWSGERSKRYARLLKNYLWQFVSCIHGSDDVFFSETDIKKDEHWERALDEHLHDCDYVIVCLTPERLHSSWIHYEVGYIVRGMAERAKNHAEELGEHSAGTCVSLLLIGVEKSEVDGPLSRFEGTGISKDELRTLGKTIAERCEDGCNMADLDARLEQIWPSFEAKLDEIAAMDDDDGRSEQLLDEIELLWQQYRAAARAQGAMRNAGSDDDRRMRALRGRVERLYTEGRFRQAEEASCQLIGFLEQRVEQGEQGEQYRESLEKARRNLETVRAAQGRGGDA